MIARLSVFGGLRSMLRNLIVFVTDGSPSLKELPYALLSGIVRSFCLWVVRSPLGTRGQLTRIL